MELREIKHTAIIEFTEEDLLLLSKAAAYAATHIEVGFGEANALPCFGGACAVAFESCASTIAMHGEIPVKRAPEVSLATLRRDRKITASMSRSDEGEAGAAE